MQIKLKPWIRNEKSREIEQLTSRIEAIKKAAQTNVSDNESRLQEIIKKVETWEEAPVAYDDAIVRQLIECVRVYKDGKLDVVFGGGITITEYVTPTSVNNCGKKKPSR